MVIREQYQLPIRSFEYITRILPSIYSFWSQTRILETIINKILNHDLIDQLKLKRLKQLQYTKLIEGKSSPVDGCMSEIVVHKLPPLHHHERVPDVGRAHVVVDVHGDQAGTGQGLAAHGLGSGEKLRIHMILLS